jgi:hypothetical protein
MASLAEARDSGKVLDQASGNWYKFTRLRNGGEEREGLIRINSLVEIS